MASLRERQIELWDKLYVGDCPEAADMPGSMEDMEAGEAILARVLAGCCQSCGKKAGEGCKCVYSAGDRDNPLRTVVGFENA